MSNPILSAQDEAHFQHLADEAERAISPGHTRRRGAQAAAHGLSLLTKVGRPRLGTMPAGPSPVWQTRLPEELSDQATALAQATGQTKSELLREAITEYLASHPAS